MRTWLAPSTLKRLGRGLLLLAFLYMLLRWFEHRQVYFPSRSAEWSPDLSGWRFEDLALRTADGIRLHGWFIPPEPEPAPSSRVVLFLHGNAGNITHREPAFHLLRGMGLAVLALDYRGYGRSEGRPGETGTYLDAEAAYHWLRQKGYAPAEILVLGESLGGGVATELAMRQPVGGLILLSTFTSIPDVGAELFPWLPVRWLSTIQYDTRAKLPRLHAPVLILHSRTDTLIRFHHAQDNFAAANEPKLLCELADDHNDTFHAPAGRDKFRAGLSRFLAQLPPRGKS